MQQLSEVREFGGKRTFQLKLGRHSELRGHDEGFHFLYCYLVIIDLLALISIQALNENPVAGKPAKYSNCCS